MKERPFCYKNHSGKGLRVDPRYTGYLSSFLASLHCKQKMVATGKQRNCSMSFDVNDNLSPLLMKIGSLGEILFLIWLIFVLHFLRQILISGICSTSLTPRSVGQSSY